MKPINAGMIVIFKDVSFISSKKMSVIPRRGCVFKDQTNLNIQNFTKQNEMKNATFSCYSFFSKAYLRPYQVSAPSFNDEPTLQKISITDV